MMQILGERKIYVEQLIPQEKFTLMFIDKYHPSTDGDKDGIDDYSDNCPYTLIGIEVMNLLWHR